MRQCKSIVLGTLVLGAAVISQLVMAQDKYPERAIRLVVPFSAGGGNDLMGRRFGARMSALLGQQVVIDNKAGAGGNIGTTEVARAKPDGYTLLLGSSSTHVINPLSEALPYDPVKSFAPIAVIGFGTYVVAAHPSVAPSLTELIRKVKAAPGKYSYGSVDGMAQLSAELFRKQAGGLQMVYVPYKGTGQGLLDLIGGQIPLVFTVVSGAMPYHNSGKLRILAVLSDKRSKAAPEIPTAVELGVPGSAAYSLMIVCAPAGTPKAVLDQLYQATSKIVRDEVFQQDMEKLGTETVSDSNPERAVQQIKDELVKWGPIVKAAALKTQ